MIKNVCVIGGGGYVGSALVPSLAAAGFNVTVLDTFWYSEPSFFTGISPLPGDVRNEESLIAAMRDQDAVIHLACISNDPSFELDPALGKDINLDSFEKTVRIANACGVKRFIYASSSSVYGVHKTKDVRENFECRPLTDYSKFKLQCEEILSNYFKGETVILRPATVCGYSPRMRLDLSVNILTAQAIANKKITVHGGEQIRPNLNILDMVRAYLVCLYDSGVIGGVFNVGGENLSIAMIADLVKGVVDAELSTNVEIEVQPIKDERSYHINSERFTGATGFRPKFGVAHAIRSIIDNWDSLEDPMNNPIYYNIKQMQKLGIKSASSL